MRGERMNVLRVVQLGKRLRVCLVADIPRLQSRQLRIGRAWTRLGHLREAKIERVGEDRRKQQRLVLRDFAGLQMCEVASKARPRLDLHQQFGDFHARRHEGRLIDQRLGDIGHRCVQWRNLQSGFGEHCVRQIVCRGEAVDRFQALRQRSSR